MELWYAGLGNIRSSDVHVKPIVAPRDRRACISAIDVLAGRSKAQKDITAGWFHTSVCPLRKVSGKKLMSRCAFGQSLAMDLSTVSTDANTTIDERHNQCRDMLD